MPVTHAQLTAPVPVPPGKLMVTVEEAAKLLSLSRAMLYRLMERRCIASVKVGTARRIPLRALQQYVDSLREE
jgi:excisionase family DNA binding protein